MQKIKDLLVKRAAELLENGTVNRVLGWKKGQFGYDVTPSVFHSADELESDFEFNCFCGANLSFYLVKECASQGKVLVFLKPCDTYSFNQLLTEHRFDRQQVYAIGVPCFGTTDLRTLSEKVSGEISHAQCTDTGVTVHTLYDGDFSFNPEELVSQRCAECKSKKHVAYDELIGEEGEVIDSHRFDEVRRIEEMSPDERFEFWQNELSRCIRCNACRDVCPACTCEKCVFGNAESGMENKAAADSFEEKMFHIIRAFHVAGRCTDCGECSRVCPQHIPLHLLNRKFIKDINSFYGEYQAGETVGARSPLVDYTEGDIEPDERGGSDA